MSIKTPLSRAAGLGSAKEGVEHWWTQRLSAIALIPLAALFVIPFAQVVGDGHAAMIELYRQPWRAVVAVLFIAVAFAHLSLGMRTVIEDYVHSKGMRMTLLIANALGCWLFGAVGVFSILKITFGG